MEGESPQEDALVAAARTVLVAAAAGLAAATLLTHLAQAIDLPFATLAPAMLLLFSAASGAVLVGGLRGPGPGLRTRRREALLLGAMCAAAGLLLLFVQHATGDDAYYLPPVVRCLAHPEAPPGEFGALWLGGPLAATPRFALAVPLDFLEGAFCRCSGMSLVHVRYLLAPPVLLSLVPLAWFVLLARFGFAPRAALAGTLIGGAVLLLLRENQAGPGCIYALRVYQAKYFALAVLVPAFAGETVRFLRTPTAASWWSLAIIATASAGCSISSMVMQCMLVPPLVVAGIVAAPGAWRRTILLVPAVAYPLGLCLWMRGDAQEFLGVSASAPVALPPSFPEAFAAVFAGPVTIPVTAAGLVATGLLLGGAHRRFFAAWLLAGLALYLNPVVGPLVIECLTSADIWWRTWYLLPLPLLIAVPGAALAARRETATGRFPVAAVLAVAAGLLLAEIPAQAAGLYRGILLVHPLPDPDRCLQTVDPIVADARWLSRVAPPGPILAPQYTSTVLPMIDSDHPVLTHWPYAVHLWMEIAGHPEDAALRLDAGYALAYRGASRRPALGPLLRLHPEIASVAADREAWILPGLDEILATAGYTSAGTAPSGLRLYTRKHLR